MEGTIMKINESNVAVITENRRILSKDQLLDRKTNLERQLAETEELLNALV